jgi:proline dehydrogenase
MARHLFSKAVVGVSASPAVAAFATRSPFADPFVRRFVAGESLDDALQVARRLQAQGLLVTLDHLGENVTSVDGAEAARRTAEETLHRIAAENVPAYLSIKLTQLGLEMGEHVVLAQAHHLLDLAGNIGLFVRLDMESSLYTARTVEIYEQLRRRYPQVGLAIQACLYRSEADVRRLAGMGASLRLCKGAYSEGPHIAYRRKRDTDRNYVRLMEYLLTHGVQPALATHDPAIIDHARAFVQAHGIERERFEFQMLYGVRRDLQADLARSGYRVRVYVPFGSQWYPYMTRRLAERPANLLSIGGSMLRERFLAGKHNREAWYPVQASATRNEQESDD